MNVDAEIRRENLRRIVEREGLAVASRKFGKPDRQINDMLAGRKSFGEKVAHQMEAHYAPDRPRGWLSQRADAAQINEPAAQYKATPQVSRDLPRNKRVQRILDLLEVTDEAGVAVVLDKAEDMARKYPLRKAKAS